MNLREAVQDFLGLAESPLLDAVVALSIFLIAVAVALVFHKLAFPLTLRFTHWAPTNLVATLMRGTRIPLTMAMIVVGGYLAVVMSVVLTPGQRNVVDAVVVVACTILGVVAVAATISNAFNWYLQYVAPQTQSNLDEQLFPLLRRLSIAVTYGVGVLLVLDQLNINISPLIAGLGLGGLAVALAVQPTLANLFAGTYVMTEGVITPGDYIQLENGMAGYVIDVGWRSTRIRTWHNNLVVVPNSRFAETIITNYSEPMPAVNVFLTCGVSYDSDLYHVEQVCQEVMDEVMESSPHAVSGQRGWFGYDSFGDSNVNFWLFVQAKNRIASFSRHTTLMQRLHHRLKQENIVINYPVRTLQFPEGWTPQMALRRNGSVASRRDIGQGQRRRARRTAPPGRRVTPAPHIVSSAPGDGPGDAPDGPG